MCCELWWRFWLCYVLTLLKCIDKFIVIGHLVSELAIIYNSSSVWNRFKTVGHLKSCLVSIRLKVLEAVGNPSINRTELFTTENICQGKLETGNFKFYKKPKSMLILNISPSQKNIINYKKYSKQTEVRSGINRAWESSFKLHQIYMHELLSS